ncbi:uncharacterized protein PHALS_02981 [Plasmopara halstedii]|uniref:Uncharacterized protein n=1 Tax=Plasmopara halstedii TaxID=4781 RepID=A0A0P1A7N5_PLAHL|nr:uncharacterized protein PHALS_02981 [Plasmopara halstedii]CEG36434.1 hypothetical protein PHALS_02981 [Plasmopara halstedii]|eukprot:XP_024572803.1 hypothetical protein PHALS_02981 [Plasmopara halstedii]
MSCTWWKSLYVRLKGSCAHYIVNPTIRPGQILGTRAYEMWCLYYLITGAVICDEVSSIRIPVSRVCYFC